LNRLFGSDEVVCLHYGRRYYYTKLSEDDLNRALQLKDDMPIKNVRAELSNGLITFTGTYQLGWGHRLLLSGKLVPKNRYEIHFVPTKATVNGIPIPAGPLRNLLNKLNPLLDMAEVPLKPEVRSIKIYSGILEVQG
ncbi:MAG: LmeA family phospholipid-binding protein, partial [Armatimonadetes bacterium]|nr:LmeA family phospholipid-binding protein [Armatimonadota bacterium]